MSVILQSFQSRIGPAVVELNSRLGAFRNALPVRGATLLRGTGSTPTGSVLEPYGGPSL
jgi:hypothetical protein